MTTEQQIPTTTATTDDRLRTALSAGERPPRATALSATMTHLWRALTAFKHFPVQLIDIVLMPLIFLLMFTYLFGGAFADSTEEYLQFYLPGVAVQAVVMMTVYTGTSLNTDIHKGVFDRFKTLPFWQPATLAGNLLGDVLRYAIALATTVGVGLLLGFRADGGVLGVLLAALVLIVFGFSVSWIFAALGVVASEPERVSGTSMIVLYPLLFMSNIFVMPETMPGWMQTVVDANPMSHAATASRALMHGTADFWDVGLILLISAGLVAVFAPLTMRLYRNKNAH
ncbi:ABC transporter permease [Streptomyces sp. NPDC012389]|uniref:ABC transporter permease n=1 Tax=unclassified Streptomyces TaxID=2593676 RepID=UPI00081D6791|nr:MULTISPECIES: ABC transporter permease [unclassified Streptomyces]MYR96307.1 ABC transporter permease [Streptomyces sp. SID4937]SCE07212.1 ABC-2 type transport system permease protein [Streptomyces sp. ScaeMP-e83]